MAQLKDLIVSGPARFLSDVYGNASNGVFYGTCDTAQATKEKVVTLINRNSFSLTTGVAVMVKFTNASAAATMTMNVNNTGAKSLMCYGTTTMSSGTTTTGWRAGATVLFVYDGTNWIRDFWENTTYYTESCYVSTAAATAAKVGTLSNYALQKGYLQVAIYNANTAASALTLDINGTGAKPIYINGSASSASNYTLPKSMYFVYYDGTNFYFRTDGNLDGPVSGKENIGKITIGSTEYTVRTGTSGAAGYITFEV